MVGSLIEMLVVARADGGVEAAAGDALAGQRRKRIDRGQDLGLDLGVVPVGVQGLEQGGHSGDVRRGLGVAPDGVGAPRSTLVQPQFPAASSDRWRRRPVTEMMLSRS